MGRVRYGVRGKLTLKLDTARELGLKLARQCGGSLVIEHNGDLFACGHCVCSGNRPGTS